jgi:hypothetical protein
VAATTVLTGPSVLLDEGLNCNRFPCYFEAHCTAECALALAGRVPLETVERITQTVDPGGTQPLVRPHDRTALDDERFASS